MEMVLALVLGLDLDVLGGVGSGFLLMVGR